MTRGPPFDRVKNSVGPAAAGHLTDRARKIVVFGEVHRLDPASTDTLEALGHEIDPDDAMTVVLRDPGRHVPDRTEAEDHQGAAVGHLCIVHALPGRRQHVGEEHKAVIRRTLGDLDRQEVAERDTEELRLAAGDLPVELGVAE